MFVKISLDYEWYGKHKDIAFVGPFPGNDEASKWQADFQLFMQNEKISGEIVLLDLNPEISERLIPLFPPDKTPKEVCDKMYNVLYKYCMG